MKTPQQPEGGGGGAGESRKALGTDPQEGVSQRGTASTAFGARAHLGAEGAGKQPNRGEEGEAPTGVLGGKMSAAEIGVKTGAHKKDAETQRDQEGKSFRESGGPWSGSRQNGEIKPVGHTDVKQNGSIKDMDLSGKAVRNRSDSSLGELGGSPSKPPHLRKPLLV